MSKKKIDEETMEEIVVEEKDYTEDFIERKLKALNNIEDRAKAKRLAERVLRNRKGK